MSITVTATQGGNTANGMVLRVLVLTGAADAVAQLGATAIADHLQHATITTTVTGSRVYGATVESPNNHQAPTAATTVIDEIADATNGERYYTFKASAATGTPGSVDLGINMNDPGGVAMVEILPDGLITEDSSAPAVVSTTSATTLTTVAFSPPPGSLLVALIATDGGSGQTTMSVTGGGSTWAQVAVANVSQSDYAGVWIAQEPPSDPFDPVITATQSSSTANGMLLQLMIITGARPSAQQTGATASKSASTGANQASITTTVTGSWVYGAVVSGLSPTAAAGTTFIANFNDTTNNNFYVACKATAATGTPGATTLGSSASSPGGCALVEILPAATIAEDTIDAPPLVTTMTAITVSTVNFNAPPGSLLVALVSSDGGAAITNMTVSGGGITWTEKIAAHATAQDYAGVWIADIPMPSGMHRVPRTLMLPWRWPDGPPLRHHYEFVETPTAVVAASVVPILNVRDRMMPAIALHRTRVASVVPAQVILSTPPFVPLAQRSPLRLFGARYRSRSVAVVPAQITVAPPAYVPQPQRVRIRAALTRRRPAATPPAAQAPAPPASRTRLKLPRLLRRAGTPTPVPAQAPPPTTWRLRLRAPQLTRPDQVSPVPLQAAPLAPTYPPQALRPRVKFGRLWRGRQATPVPAQVVVQPPAYPPVGVRSHVKFWQAWRAHSATVVPPQIVLTPPAYPPQGLRLRARALRLYRGHQATPVPAQITATPPTYIPGPARAARMRAVMVRRGRAVSPPVAQAAPPLITRVRLRLARMVRGRLGKPVPAQVVIPPPAYSPSAVRSKRQLWTWRRRKLTSAGWMVAAQHSCDTTRPTAGTTTRPGSGTTAYATAMTARPSSGTTARPNSGETSPPCGP